MNSNTNTQDRYNSNEVLDRTVSLGGVAVVRRKYEEYTIERTGQLATSDNIAVEEARLSSEVITESAAEAAVLDGAVVTMTVGEAHPVVIADDRRGFLRQTAEAFERSLREYPTTAIRGPQVTFRRVNRNGGAA